ncbi:pyridoxal phosphate-dependent aminotransferase [Solicola sp. PLA-1-18]|uniref:pyridoxal phosphate-dependent aminotransferase n=1 Tax=Solicola sp. PLA-1-18 TaxID=3380532 RepID=UPI003B780BF9
MPTDETTARGDRTRRTVGQSEKLHDVLYDIRGPVNARAAEMEAAGHRVLKLNIGNPQTFGFEAPDSIVADMVAALPVSQGYSDARGIVSARRAVVQRYELEDGFPDVDVDDVWLGNGVSELIQICLQALLDDGDEVLVPSPDYPLWTASTKLAGGVARHYRCEESNGWQPDLEHLASQIGPRTRAIVVINPNNPTGAVYSEQVLDGIAALAREHDLVLMSDEIYDKVLYDDAVHVPLATRAPDLLTLTFSGLSKAYRVCGYRAGWVVVSDPAGVADDYEHGINLLASMRLCPNVPAQHAIQVALGGHQSINDLVLPGGRLRDQRDAAVTALRAIPGVSVVEPRGALYVFPRLDPEVYPVRDDERLALDLLLAQKILLTQGTGFNWPDPDHLRIVTLPRAEELTDAIGRLGTFLATYRQD